MTSPTTLAGAQWRKSSRSSALGNDCVEVAPVASGTAVRDSKNPDGPALVFGREAWRQFTGHIRTR